MKLCKLFAKKISIQGRIKGQCHQEVSMQEKQQRLSFFPKVKKICDDKQLVLNSKILSDECHVCLKERPNIKNYWNQISTFKNFCLAQRYMIWKLIRPNFFEDYETI